MKKILLIEDEEPIRRVLIRILEEENKDYLITECEDGKLGFNTLNKEDFDLVLCDICLLYTSPSPRDGLLSRMPSSA